MILLNAVFRAHLVKMETVGVNLIQQRRMKHLSLAKKIMNMMRFLNGPRYLLLLVLLLSLLIDY